MNKSIPLYIKSFLLLLLFFILLPGSSWASDYWFYPKATVAPSGQGKVYISKTKTSTPPKDTDYGETSEITAWSEQDYSTPTASIYCYSKPGTTMGDCYSLWTLGGVYKGEGTSYTMTVTGGNKDAESAPTSPNIKIQVNFAKVRAINGDYGTASASPLANVKNANVKLTAKEYANYVFVGWVKDGSTEVVSTSNPWTVTAGDDKVTYKPTFMTSRVTVSNDGNGIAVSSKPSNKSGDKVALSAEPILLYKFKGWVKDNGSTPISTENPYTVTATDDSTDYKATFEKSTYAYYRVQNTRKVDYTDTRNGKSVKVNQVYDFLKVVDNNTTGTHSSGHGKIDFDLHALDFVSANEDSIPDSVLCDPATILFVKKVKPNDNSDNYYDWYAQGVSTFTVAKNNHFEITHALGGDRVVYTLHFSSGYLQEYYKTFDNSNSETSAKYWAKIVDENDNYLGLAPNAQMTDGSYYYQTLMTSFPYSYPDNISAYYVGKVENNKATLVRLNLTTNTGNKHYVPANTPIILRTTSTKVSDNKLMPLMGEDVNTTSIEGNLLQGTLLSSNGIYYCNGRHLDGRDSVIWDNRVPYNANTMRVMSINSKGVLGFYKLPDGSYMKPNRAWLSGNFTTTSGKLTIEFDDEGVTEIQTPLLLEGQGEATDVWYNLQGQRVDTPRHGIYIHNGKKVVVK